MISKIPHLLTAGYLTLTALITASIALAASHPLRPDDPPAQAADGFSPYVTEFGRIATHRVLGAVGDHERHVHDDLEPAGERQEDRVIAEIAISPARRRYAVRVAEGREPEPVEEAVETLPAQPCLVVRPSWPAGVLAQGSSHPSLKKVLEESGRQRPSA